MPTPAAASFSSRALEMEPVYTLWDELAKFPAADMDAALRHLMEWIARSLDADNVLWLGTIRVLDGANAEGDPFLGWRLRARKTLVPDTDEYRKLIASYLVNEHYGKLTASYYRRHDETKVEPHVGQASRALVAGAGKFRVHRMRDGWIDFAAFRRTFHYQLYYRNMGIADRLWLAFPLSADAESVFLVDRHRRPDGPRRRHFSKRESELAGLALRGISEFHRRLFLYSGLLLGDKPLSALERQILQGLLTGQSEKEIASSTGQKPTTMHKYVTALFTRFGVKSRAGLMSLWLGSK